MADRKKDIGTVMEIIEFGIVNIEDQEMRVSLKDFAYLYKTISELRRFFHNPDHYKDIGSLERYVLGKEGMYAVLNKVYTEVLEKMMTPDIEEILEDDKLYSPKYPFYYFE